MKSTGESQISTDKSQVAVYFNDISQDQLSQSFNFGTMQSARTGSIRRSTHGAQKVTTTVCESEVAIKLFTSQS
ncbi:unnamed protein product, partial [Brassica oleracea]